MNAQTILDASKHVLQEYYPEYRVESPLPPNLLEMCVGMLIEEKKEHWSNGQLESQETYVNGKKHGEWKLWRTNGQLESQETYVNGKEHGEWKRWYENGQPHVQSTYVNGELHGELKVWHENGQLWSHEMYVNGELKMWHEL